MKMMKTAKRDFQVVGPLMASSIGRYSVRLFLIILSWTSFFTFHIRISLKFGVSGV